MGGGASKRKKADDAGFRKYKDILNKAKITDLYQPGKKLGKGNMATVYLYTRINDRKQYAAKVVERASLTHEREFTNELEILAYLKGHDHILEVEDVFADKKNFYLITDLVMGGELFDRICDYGQYTEGMAKNMILPILEALQFIHDKGVIHRDIKPENLLLMDDSPDAALKVADFGVACWRKDLASGPNKYLKCGTPEYMAPEMYVNRDAPYEIPVDIWAMGCVVFIMMCGWHPFQDQENFVKQRNKILTSDMHAVLADEAISDQAKNFIEGMLIKDPNKRLTIPQILKHPWLVTATSNNNSLQTQQQRLKRYQHLRRLRKVSFAVLAATRASKLALGKSAPVEKSKSNVQL